MNQLIVITLTPPISASYGPTFSITADIGTVTPAYATLTQLLNGFVTSANTLATEFTLTPVFSTCPPIVVNIIPECGCYVAFVSNSSYTINWTDCNGDPQSEPFSDKNPIYCSQTLPTLTGGTGGDPTVTKIPDSVCVEGKCVTSCRCITIQSDTEGLQYLNYIDCNGVYRPNEAIYFGITQFCGTFVSKQGDFTVTVGDVCIENGEGYSCPEGSTCMCMYFTGTGTSFGGSYAFTNCNGLFVEGDLTPGQAYHGCVDITQPITIKDYVVNLQVGPCDIGVEAPTCPSYSYNCYTVSQIGDGIQFRYIDVNGVIQQVTLTGSNTAKICSFGDSISQVAGVGTIVVSSAGPSCTSNEQCAAGMEIGGGVK